VLHGLDVTVDQQVDTALITACTGTRAWRAAWGSRRPSSLVSWSLTHGTAPMATIDDFVAVAELADWVQAGPFSVGLLRLVLSGVEAPGSSFAATTEAAAAMVLGIQASEEPDKPALLFTALQTR